MQRAGLQRDELQPDDGAASDVAAFLRANPGWLAARPELYALLDPPRRVHGERLADHMAAMLQQERLRTAALADAGLGAAADRRAAEGFAHRVQDAVVGLLRAPDAAWCLQHDLAGLLHLDSARLCSEAAPAPPGAVPVPPGTVAGSLGQRAAVVRIAVRDTLLHGEAVLLAGREALVRVPLASGPALLALACRDGSGLAGATTQALAFLGQAVGAALER